MSFFAVTYTYVDSPQLAEVRPAHREYLRTLVDAGTLRASGPLVDIAPGGALLIFEAPDADGVARALADDPFQLEGLVEQTTVIEWDPVIGIFAS